jgi:hypothetical protein
MVEKTYFVFKAADVYILVATVNGKTRTETYPQFPHNVISVLQNIGYKRV